MVNLKMKYGLEMDTQTQQGYHFQLK